jgi:acyl carrier protein
MTLPTRDEILEKLSGALDRASNGRAKLERLDDDAKIIEDIGLSSLDLLDLRCELEELWQTKLTDEELMRLRTVGDVVRLITDRASLKTTPDD